MKNLYPLLVFALFFQCIHGQQIENGKSINMGIINTSGGDALSGNGSVAYSLGSVFYTAKESSNIELHEGIQQAEKQTTEQEADSEFLEEEEEMVSDAQTPVPDSSEEDQTPISQDQRFEQADAPQQDEEFNGGQGPSRNQVEEGLNADQASIDPDQSTEQDDTLQKEETNEDPGPLQGQVEEENPNQDAVKQEQDARQQENSQEDEANENQVPAQDYAEEDVNGDQNTVEQDQSTELGDPWEFEDTIEGEEAVKEQTVEVDSPEADQALVLQEQVTDQQNALEEEETAQQELVLEQEQVNEDTVAEQVAGQQSNSQEEEEQALETEVVEEDFPDRNQVTVEGDQGTGHEETSQEYSDNIGQDLVDEGLGNEIQENNELEITTYPNPVGTSFFIYFKEFINEQATYQLFDYQGRLLESNKITGKTTKVTVQNLEPSTYLLRIIISKQTIGTFKILKK